MYPKLTPLISSHLYYSSVSILHLHSFMLFTICLNIVCLLSYEEVLILMHQLIVAFDVSFKFIIVIPPRWNKWLHFIVTIGHCCWYKIAKKYFNSVPKNFCYDNAICFIWGCNLATCVTSKTTSTWFEMQYFLIYTTRHKKKYKTII